MYWKMINMLQIKTSLYPKGIPYAFIMNNDIVEFIASASGFSSAYNALCLQSDDTVVCCSVGYQSKLEISGLAGGFDFLFKNQNMPVAIGTLNTLPCGLLDFRSDPFNESHTDFDNNKGFIIPDMFGATSKYLDLLYDDIADIKQVPQIYLRKTLNPLIFIEQQILDVNTSYTEYITLAECQESMLTLEQHKQSFATMFGNILPSIDAVVQKH